jgi:hypothetical protein
MNVKNFLISGIVGGLVDFFLGWVLYGMLFKDIYPQNENMNLMFIFLGCMTFGLFIAYIYSKWAHITNPVTGMKAGATIGIFSSLSMNFFMYSGMEVNYQNMALDIAISTFIGAIMGAAVALTSSKLK